MALPIWQIVRLDGKLGIQCPRKNCRGKAVVSRAWLNPRRVVTSSGDTRDETETTIRGRSCTYCFRAAEIPEEFIK